MQAEDDSIEEIVIKIRQTRFKPTIEYWVRYFRHSSQIEKFLGDINAALKFYKSLTDVENPVMLYYISFSFNGKHVARLYEIPIQLAENLANSENARLDTYDVALMGLAEKIKEPFSTPLIGNLPKDETR